MRKFAITRTVILQTVIEAPDMELAEAYMEYVLRNHDANLGALPNGDPLTGELTPTETEGAEIEDVTS